MIMEQGETSKLDSLSSKVDSLTSELTQSKEQLQSITQQLDDKCTELQAKEQAFTELTESKAKLQSEVDVLKAENNSLRDKIADRDKLIEEIKADKSKLNERLDKAETNISNLTTALTAAQALHGMDKQQAVIEVDAAPTKEQASADQSETRQEPQEKLSFFQRLFKRSKNQR